MDASSIIIGFLAGAAIGGVIAWVMAQARMTNATAGLQKDNAVLQEKLEQERKLALEGSGAKEKMAQELQKQNRAEIDTVLGPFKEKLKELQQELQQANKESATQRAVLGEQIRALSAASTTMTAETASLTKALKGESQTQGAWGERILSNILEKSGLREGEEYILQASHTNEDGQRLRPDALVKLPGGQQIIIDSKVSLVAFHACVNAASEEERIAPLAQHLTSMRTHIKGLSAKEYQRLAGGDLDYVVMFVPIEGALAAALQGDPELTSYALEGNVTIATPTTLMIVLRTVANIWQVERRNRNAETIAARAGKIYDKLAGFIEDFVQLGSRLNQARGAYDEALNKISLGRGNLLSQVEQLKDLGAKTSKSLPASLVDEAVSNALPEPGDAQDAA